MKKLPVWLLLWVGVMLRPQADGSFRLDPVLALLSWMSALFGAAIPIKFCAGLTSYCYWYPSQMALALFLAAVGALLGGYLGALFSAALCFKRVNAALEEVHVPPMADPYPLPPSSGMERVNQPKPKPVHTATYRRSWLATGLLLAVGCLVSWRVTQDLHFYFTTPRISMGIVEIPSHSAPKVGWRDVEAEFCRVRMPSTPTAVGRDGQQSRTVWENPDTRLIVIVEPIDAGNLPRNLNELAAEASVFKLVQCRQATMPGLELTAEVPRGICRCRVLWGQTHAYALVVVSNDPTQFSEIGQAFLNSFQESKSK